MGITLIGGFSAPIVGFIFAHTGSFNNNFIFAMVLCSLILALVSLAAVTKKRLIAEHDNKPPVQT
jgi:cyanate permease